MVKLRSMAISLLSVCSILLFISLFNVSPTIAQQNPTPTPQTQTNTFSNSVTEPERRDFSDALLKQLKLPTGFTVSVYAQGLGNPRMMAFGSDGTLYVTRPMTGDVIALKAKSDYSQSAGMQVVAQNLPLVHGIAIRDGKMYLVGSTKIYTSDLKSDGTVSQPQVVVSDLLETGQHSARTLVFGPDGMIYMTIGSPCNACRAAEEYATILQFKPDFSARTVFASGLRNTIGFGWHPVTGEMWGMDHGIDSLGDDVPPEELNLIQKGNKYGWPFCYGDKQVVAVIPGNPSANMTKAQYCQTTTAPVLSYQAHSAPIGMLFYTGSQFPADYKNDAFVAMRGSWNRNQATGYKVVRLHFQDGKPSNFEDFLTGFLIEDGKAQFGRVAGLVQAPDGSLFISEDTNGGIYRVTYSAAK